MNRYVFSLLLGSYFVLWSFLPVSADWEFTKWGMSPEQVVQASGGQAHPPHPSEIPSVLLTQDWQSGRFLFVVLYFFEKREEAQRLSRIQLELQNTELRDEVLTYLKRKYGAMSAKERRELCTANQIDCVVLHDPESGFEVLLGLYQDNERSRPPVGILT